MEAATLSHGPALGKHNLELTIQKCPRAAACDRRGTTTTGAGGTPLPPGEAWGLAMRLGTVAEATPGLTPEPAHSHSAPTAGDPHQRRAGRASSQTLQRARRAP